MFKDILKKESSQDYSWQSFASKAPAFVSNVIRYAESLGLNLDGLKIDHLALRIADKMKVDRLRVGLDLASVDYRPLSEAIINGRPILIYKLQSSIDASGFEVPCIELPYPAPDHNYPEDGWEHVEVVLPGKGTIEERFKRKFPNFKGKYEVHSPKAESEQLPNDTIVIKNPDNKMQCIKFHCNSIEEVVGSKGK